MEHIPFCSQFVSQAHRDHDEVHVVTPTDSEVLDPSHKQRALARAHLAGDEVVAGRVWIIEPGVESKLCLRGQGVQTEARDSANARSHVQSSSVRSSMVPTRMECAFPASSRTATVG
jgi:hypothetical protein